MYRECSEFFNLNAINSILIFISIPAPPLGTSTWESPQGRPLTRKGGTQGFLRHIFVIMIHIIVMLYLHYWEELSQNETSFVRRRLRQEEERRMRLTSYRLLQPRTTASLRNRYLCKVMSKKSHYTIKWSEGITPCFSRLVLVFQVTLAMELFQRQGSLLNDCRSLRLRCRWI